jgi:hypothetical protein
MTFFMSTKQVLFVVYGILIMALMLPFRSEVRMGLFLLLLGISVFTLLGGGMQYLKSLFD